MALKGNTKTNHKIFVGKPGGRCPLEETRLDLNGDVDGRSRLDSSGCG